MESSEHKFVTQEPLIPCDNDNSRGVVFTWKPPPEWNTVPLKDFTLSLRCVGEKGSRRFRPVAERFELKACKDGFQFCPVGPPFELRAYAAGSWILNQEGNLPAEDLNAHRPAFWFWRKMRSCKARLKSQIIYDNDLKISEWLRDESKKIDLLPDTVGLDKNDRGTKWSVDRLRDEGRRRAAADGIKQPDEQDLFNYGLAAAAERNPDTLSPEEVPLRIRNALFDRPVLDNKELEKLLPEISKRFKKAIIKRFNAEIKRQRQSARNSGIDENLQTGSARKRTKSIDEWWAGGHSSVERAILRQAPTIDGEDRMKLVQACLVDEAWASCLLFAKCITAAMRHFVDHFNLKFEPLTPSEERAFSREYTSQPWLGNLTLVQMEERRPLLDPIASQLIEPENNSAGVHVMYRLLEWYSLMARDLRELNCKKKRGRDKKRGRNQSLSLAKRTPDKPDEPHERDRSEREREQLAKLAETVARENGFKCGCVQMQLSRLAAEVVGEQAGRYDVALSCNACKRKANSLVDPKAVIASINDN
jgi:hypothetical protein